MISDLSDALFNDARGIVHYHDMLAEHAFGNYRDLLKAVTLSPMMGEYLSTVRNEKTDTERNSRPDENYARELMQLFTIGLVELEDDGAVRLDAAGDPIPTYDQSTIKGFASVFTGWMYANAPYWYWDGWGVASTTEPMKAFPDYHDTESKILLNNEILPAGMTAEQDLDAALDNVFAHSNDLRTMAESMLKLLKKLLGFKDSGDLGGIGMEIRELIKGKEIDPQKLIEMQTAINEMEAKHRTIFVAGWRPFIGWVCGIALAYNFIIRDMLVWYMGAATAPPALQMEHLMTVLIGMLGLGGMRTFEKLNNKSN